MAHPDPNFVDSVLSTGIRDAVMAAKCRAKQHSHFFITWAIASIDQPSAFRYDGTGFRLDGDDLYLRLHFVTIDVSDKERSLHFFMDHHGFSQSPNSAGEEFGDELLVDSLRRHNAVGACAMAQAVVQDVAHFSAGDQFDEITPIIAKRMGQA
jgi:hypothetical protein